ncbi:uncharacterized protein N7511_002814 [Penicillium nucicola]|uniref:uncharacterized protein n=1 Tax=Penicillium nucicola TaxID=1850975 RepID=UPI002544F1C9|nr:uncharacterized protein N7511_002814 [Penicillium nucicola]KAJ5770763.1 hypothetical protein N7511_002814 [Penicillium nucicola]
MTPSAPVQPPANHTSAEVVMGGTHDATLPNAQEPAPELELESIELDPEPPVKKNAGFNFLDFLTSPIVEIVVGKDANQTILTAHQTFLLQSPLLASLVAEFEPAGPRLIKLPDEDVDAFDLAVNDGSETLLRHARVYTLADKLGLPALKSLAHGKIHKVKSSPHAEHLYARYVYTNTPASDITIRKPVASYWASHSHTLRRDVGDDFKKLCIEVPEFSFD